MRFNGVNGINSSREVMLDASYRRFVKVAPPTIHVGIGSALRQAFAPDGEHRSLERFEALLAKLD